MEILLLLNLAALIYISVKINDLIKFYISKSVKVTSFTSLNPIFSEEEINFYKKRQTEYQKESDTEWDEMTKLEKQEIKAHSVAGKDKKSFEPSKELQETMGKVIVAIKNRDNFRSYWRKMVEANISVLNGKKIDEAESSLYKEEDLSSVGLMYFDYKYDPRVKKDYEEFAKNRAEYWRDSWERIVKEFNKE